MPITADEHLANVLRDQRWNIVQIIPTSQPWTMWASRGRDQPMMPHDIVCWALIVEDDYTRSVEPMLVRENTIVTLRDFGAHAVTFTPTNYPEDHAL